jgi:hypothetical protein
MENSVTYENKYTLAPSGEAGVLNVLKNGVPALCRLIQPVPVPVKVATAEKQYYLQFTPCNTTCPNCNIRREVIKTNDESVMEQIDFLTITCGAGYKTQVFFEEPKNDTPIFKL